MFEEPCKGWQNGAVTNKITMESKCQMLQKKYKSHVPILQVEHFVRISEMTHFPFPASSICVSILGKCSVACVINPDQA